MFKSIRWKLMVVYLLMIVFAMQLISLYFMKSLENYHLQNHTENIQSQSNVLADFLERYFVAGIQNDRRELDTLVRDFAKQTRAEIQIIDREGVIVSDSVNPQFVGQKSVQVEVTRALLGSRGEAIRMDADSGQRKKILATPIKTNYDVVGVVYIQSSLEPIYKTLKEINTLVTTAMIFVLGITSVLVIVLARTITTPLMEVTKKASDMAEGNFDQEVKVTSDDEIGKLGTAFNQLTYRLRDALDENAKEKNRLQAVLDHMSDGVIAADADGKILIINPMAQKMIGITEEQAMIKNILDVLEIQEFKKDWLHLKKKHTFETIIEHQELMYQLHVSPLKTDEAKDYGILMILHDITEREQLEQQRREFVANVSHELRTPLTTIRSYTEALVEGADADPELRGRFTEVIQNETERMIRLVNDLLELSKLDSRTIQWKFSKIDVNVVIEDVLDRFYMQLKNKGIQGILDLTEKPAYAIIDRDRVDQVLNNLLSNAIKYTGNGGSITIKSEEVIDQGRKCIKISVKDTGTGIAPKDIDRIFERFYTVDKARSREMGGTGLGLAISKEIIKAHQGDIQISSEINQGTTLSFTLPVERGGL
ncbi:hypothetical protein BHU72_12960 [Desulfuribacillus stibiiarsenatis]|uniref:histidine kinase n=1 Tax=Desulfuribacillus stibiiarsenatis TaxID=1390249 RepID=A0A1E5L8R2_9FIRM|nr:ATP-binding protein [Desulfuribacillus stibiiarsenatis]OEH86516.1 hypothetical protein BHU72_12960 [Desulfuribacillus stibiiarsenatis]